LCHGTEIVTKILAPKNFSKLKLMSFRHCQIVTRWPKPDTIYGQEIFKMVDRVTFLPNRDTILVVLQIFDRYKTQS